MRLCFQYLFPLYKNHGLVSVLYASLLFGCKLYHFFTVWDLLPRSPSLATVPRRGERGVRRVPRSADGRIGGLSPLRLLFRWPESGGTSDPCLRCVHSRVEVTGGAGEVVAAASVWNNSTGALSPPRQGLLGRRRWASGGVSRGSGDLSSLGAPGEVVAAEPATAQWRFCSPALAPPLRGLLRPHGGVCGDGVVADRCSASIAAAACTGGGPPPACPTFEALRSGSSASTSSASLSSGCCSFWAYAWMTSQLPDQQRLARLWRRRGGSGAPSARSDGRGWLGLQGPCCNFYLSRGFFVLLFVDE